MAIYHFSVQVLSRAEGRSAVAAAAYRAGTELFDERLGRHHNFSQKDDVICSEVLLPEGAPVHLADRSTLWNAVEASEKRKDAQLCREIEFAVPREMPRAEGIALAREFVRREFVAHGMIADLNVHAKLAKDGVFELHAHVMLTMRTVDADGFGAKARKWNRQELIPQWRKSWADHANTALARVGIDLRIDHRSNAARGITLEPQNKIGPSADRRNMRGEPSERADDHVRIARENGEKILADPAIALNTITQSQATFTTRDLAMFVHRHTDGKAQFDAVMAAVTASSELVAVGRDAKGQERFTSREMIAVEARLEAAATMLARRSAHGVARRHVEAALTASAARGMVLSSEQQAAFTHLLGSSELASVIGFAGSGKSAMLGVAREAWEGQGYTVRGLALSGIAAENLEGGSGVVSRTIASLEHQWSQGRDLLSDRDVLVIDEAGMIGSRQMERVLSAAAAAGAKVVLVGDPEQLQAIEAGAAFRALTERHGAVEITAIRRQRADWQRDATIELATGRTAEAINAYAERGLVHAADTREAALYELIDGWDRARIAAPERSRMILTHTNAAVRGLNEQARERVRAGGGLGDDVTIAAERGVRSFAIGDRLMFLKNERGMGVKNGTLGTIEAVTAQAMTVHLDDGREVAFDLKDYTQIDHGYAATIHKSQGVTVDQVHVLATPGLDRHAAYVALTRHRDGVELHYGRDDFADDRALLRTLSRERAKDVVSDYTLDAERVRMFAAWRGLAAPAMQPAPGSASARKVDMINETIAPGAMPMPTPMPMPLSAPITPPPTPMQTPTAVLKPTLPTSALAPTRKVGKFAGFTPKPAPTAPRSVMAPKSTDSGRIRDYARAFADIAAMAARRLPIVPHQKTAMARTTAALSAIGPHCDNDLAQAFRRDPRLLAEAAAGSTGAAIAAVRDAARLRTEQQNPADRPENHVPQDRATPIGVALGSAAAAESVLPVVEKAADRASEPVEAPISAENLRAAVKANAWARFGPGMSR